MGLTESEQAKIMNSHNRTLEDALIRFLDRKNIAIPQREYSFELISGNVRNFIEELQEMYGIPATNLKNYSFTRNNSFLFYLYEFNKGEESEFLQLARNKDQEDEENISINYSENQIIVSKYFTKDPTSIEIKKFRGGVEALEFEINLQYMKLFARDYFKLIM
jgi:uncharacterized membrane protein